MLKHVMPTNKQYSQGATLIEVLVSVFLMTFGVLGLMAAQIRSVAALSEAENRSIVAQAADNLSDGMQLNPKVIRKQNSVTDFRVIRLYDEYHKKGSVDMTKSYTLPNIPQNTKISKKDFANQQISQFEYALSLVPNATSMEYVICLDKKNPADPTFDDTGKITNPNCTPGQVTMTDTQQTVIKVVWAVRADREDAKAAIYTYQVRVPS